MTAYDTMQRRAEITNCSVARRRGLVRRDGRKSRARALLPGRDTAGNDIAFGHTRVRASISMAGGSLVVSACVVIGLAVTGTGCVTQDYGDVADVMGNTTASHFNAFQKERLGWLGAAGQPGITTVSAR